MLRCRNVREGRSDGRIAAVGTRMSADARNNRCRLHGRRPSIHGARQFSGCIDAHQHDLNQSDLTPANRAQEAQGAGQCAEALGNRALAVAYYRQAVDAETSNAYGEADDLRRLPANGPLLSPAALEARAQDILREAREATANEQPDPETAAATTAMMGAMLSGGGMAVPMAKSAGSSIGSEGEPSSGYGCATNNVGKTLCGPIYQGGSQ